MLSRKHTVLLDDENRPVSGNDFLKVMAEQRKMIKDRSNQGLCNLEITSA